MKIAFNVQPIVKKYRTGVGYCEYLMIQNILKIYKENQYRFDFISTGNKKYEFLQLKELLTKNIIINRCFWFNEFIYRILINLLPIPYSLFFGKCDEITHFFDFIIPFGVHGKKIVTIHDMVFMAFPETMRFRTRIMLKMNIKKTCKRADVIITDSEFSKNEIIKYLKIQEEKIKIVPLGVNNEIFFKITDLNIIKNVKEKYSIYDNYFLYLGTIEPRKNLERLIRSYKLLIKNNKNVPVLVISGWSGWAKKNLLNIVYELKIEKYIIFTGYIQEEDKVPLLCGAFAFLFPSLYEGFGLPPLEAMACGTPVITSKTSSLNDVVGDAALLVDPLDIKDIYNKLECLLYNKELRDNLSKKGIERAKMFSWENSVVFLMNIYKEIINKK